MLNPNEQRTTFEIRKARKLTLDLVESFLGTHSQWQFIRSRLLQIFGKQGLESLLIDVEELGKEKINVLRRSKASYFNED